MTVVSRPLDRAYRLPPASSVPSAMFTLALRSNTFTLNAPPMAVPPAPAAATVALSIQASLLALRFMSPSAAVSFAPPPTVVSATDLATITFTAPAPLPPMEAATEADATPEIIWLETSEVTDRFLPAVSSFPLPSLVVDSDLSTITFTVPPAATEPVPTLALPEIIVRSNLLLLLISASAPALSFALLPIRLSATLLFTTTLIAPPRALPPLATLMAPVNSWVSPVCQAVCFTSPPAVISVLSPDLATALSLFTSTATVTPTLALAGAADRLPAMTRVVASSAAVTFASPLPALTFTLLPSVARMSLSFTATATEPDRLAEVWPVATEPAMAST